MTDLILTTQIDLYLLCPRRYRLTYADTRSRLVALASGVPSVPDPTPTVQPTPPTDTQRGEWLGTACVYEGNGMPKSADAVRFERRSDLDAIMAESAALLAARGEGTPHNLHTPRELPFRVALVDRLGDGKITVPIAPCFSLVAADDTLVELTTATRSFDQTTLLHHVHLAAYATYPLPEHPVGVRLDVQLALIDGQSQPVDITWERADMVRFFFVANGLVVAM